MSEFINELKKEHQELFSILESCKKGQGIVGGEWKDKLFSAKSLLISHLTKEDKTLYPALEKAGKTNPSLLKLSQDFSKEMKPVSEKAILFLNQYMAVSSGTEFVQDYAELEILLKDRMKKEEEKLFPEYEKIAG